MTLTICENNCQSINTIDDFGKKLKEQFASPPAKYRGKPFWAWNGKLEKDELIRQIDIMHKMGMGGFFMHSRTGLQTPYLSDEWFDCIRVCCEKAKQLGIEAWVYDEDRWPSGFAGGKVTDTEKYRQKRLQFRLFSKKQFDWSEDYLAVFSSEIDGTNAYNVRRIRSKADIANDINPFIIAFSVISSPVSEVYNGFSYVDTLSKEAISRFIETTHQAYKKNVGDYFGSVIKGVFTDEPNHGATCIYVDQDNDKIESPWTEKLPAIFEKRYGYDIVDNLMAVFFDVDGKHISKPRADYHDCRTFLFVNAFAKQIWQWCNLNNILFTGHILNESPMIEQASFVGSAMRFYEYMDVPGVDILTDRHVTTGGRPEYDTVKQCVSVQRQMGRDKVLSELYGCTGWDFSFEGHKSCGDWQAALGVNLRCHHHMWYSMQGQAKRDYPASISYQSPWWQYYSSVEDYFSRINVLMDKGKAISKLLVIHPNETIWQMIKPGWCTKNSDALLHEWQRTEQINELEAKYLYIRDCLVNANIDFDYGDEEMLSRLGEVDLSDGKLNFGCCRYEVVLVPPLKTIRNTTVNLLERFVEHGGKVVVVENMPDYVDAVRADSARYLQEKCFTVNLDKYEILDAVKTTKTIEVFEEDGSLAEDILCRCNEDDFGRYVFICNTRKNGNTRRLRIKIYNTHDFISVQRWNPFNGKNCNLNIQVGEDTAFDANIAPCGSDLVALFRDEFDCKDCEKLLKVKKTVYLDEPVSYSLSEPNVLVLDKARFAIDGKWQQELDILEIDNKLRQRIGLKPRNGKMAQPWVSDTKLASYEIKLMFGFNADYACAEDVFLVLEKPQSVTQIKVNGKTIEKSVVGWWIDKSLKKLSLPAGIFIEGNNQIELTIDYAECIGLEAAYLLGSFGVRLRGSDVVMTTPQPLLVMGDWCNQGLPFYSGAVSYHFVQDIFLDGEQSVFVEIEQIKGACAVIYVNGDKVAVLWCKPLKADISEFLVDGRNEIVIEVVSHRRNTLGPLHLKGQGQRPGWTGPAEFSPSEDYRRNDYSIVPCGLFKGLLRYFAD